MPVKSAHRRRHKRLGRKITGVIDQKPRCEIIRAIGDDVVIGNQRERIAGIKPLFMRDDVELWIEGKQMIARALGFGLADVCRRVKNLPLQIIQRDDIIINDPDRADA